MIASERVELVISGEPLLTPTVGVGVYTARLIAALLRHSDVNFRVIVDHSLRGQVSALPEDRCSFIRSPQWPHPILRQLQRAHWTMQVVRHEYPNAIFHSPAPFWSSYRAAKTVVTLHDCIYRHFPAYGGLLGWRKLFAIACEHFAAASTLVLTDSEFSKVDLATSTSIPEGKLKVLYPWVTAEAAARELVEEYLLQRKLPQRFWLYVGGYDYRKNVEFLLRAYADACRACECQPLVLAGEIPARKRPPYSDPIGVAQRCGVLDKLVLLGRVAETEMALLYRAAGLLVFPSLYEGFGLPPAEAMAVGTPVLTSNTSSLREVVASEHCRFDPYNRGELRDKLVQAARAPQSFKVTLRSEFTEHYGIARYLELLRTI